MLFKLRKEDIDNATIRQLERMSGEDVRLCYQCGNCSGGCPVSYEMDVTPSQMIRLLQIGDYEAVLSAKSMWSCVGCLQCYSRCPKSVSAAGLFEGLRQLTLRKGEDHAKIEDMDMPLLKKAPQQALVCGFRKLVS